MTRVERESAVVSLLTLVLDALKIPCDHPWMREMMRLTWKAAGFAFLALGVAVVSPAPPSVPEIDPSSGVNALALLAGAFLIIRTRKK
jgi:hypothetical protein